MDIGVSIFNGIDHVTQVEFFKKYGVNRTFLFAEYPNFDEIMRLFAENGIICETLHSPFNKINDMWSDNEEDASSMLRRLKDTIDKCEKYNVPVAIVHLSSGRPMPAITPKGIERFTELFDYAKSKGVTVALENQRYLENISYFMDNYDYLNFCWDNGHEYGFSKGINFMNLFGDRLVALHIHDNRCGIDTDDHLLPFDGNIDFDEVAKSIASSNFEGTLMLEIGKRVLVEGERVYESMSDEEYISRAVSSARRIADMVEKYRKTV